MAKEQKTELTVIDFTKFSVAQLPELKGKKEEIASIIKANPIVEIVDNATYESAKKSRTAVKTLRTGLEKEQKDVKKKIKEHVLDVVDKEYDTLVLGVKSAEQSRQEPITAWEEKKEQERIDGIKSTISLLKKGWEIKISELTFEGIDTLIEDLNITDSGFDRVSLQEFEVLFDDAISSLRNVLDIKIHTLHEQEKIRIDNLVIEEKNAENKRIQEWQRTWNANIDTLKFDDIKDVKAILFKSKLADLKHYSAEYEEIYSSTEKRLHSQIEFISKAEEQRIAKEKFDKEQAEIAEKNRIAQEKFLAEKKEFEEKQLNIRTENRIKQLIDLGIESDVIDLGLGNGSWANLKYSAINESDDSWNNTLTWVKNKIEARTPKEEIDSKESWTEQGRLIDKDGVLFDTHLNKVFNPNDCHIVKNQEDVSGNSIVNIPAEEFFKNISDTEVVFEDVSQKSVEPIAEFDLPKEVNWVDIINNFKDSNIPNKIELLWSWLIENYNVPTKKQ